MALCIFPLAQVVTETWRSGHRWKVLIQTELQTVWSKAGAQESSGEQGALPYSWKPCFQSNRLGTRYPQALGFPMVLTLPLLGYTREAASPNMEQGLEHMAFHPRRRTWDPDPLGERIGLDWVGSSGCHTRNDTSL